MSLRKGIGFCQQSESSLYRLLFCYTNLLKRAKISLKSANTNIYIVVYNIEVKALTKGKLFFCIGRR